MGYDYIDQFLDTRKKQRQRDTRAQAPLQRKCHFCGQRVYLPLWRLRRHLENDCSAFRDSIEGPISGKGLSSSTASCARCGTTTSSVQLSVIGEHSTAHHMMCLDCIASFRQWISRVPWRKGGCS